MTPNQREATARMSERDFIAWGAEQVAYVKPMIVDDQKVYGIFTGGGEPLGYAEGFAIARAAIVQNDLEPVSVH